MGEYYQEQAPTGGVSPVLMLGVMIYVMPMILRIFNLNLPKWIGTIGFIVLLLGVGLTIYSYATR